MFIRPNYNINIHENTNYLGEQVCIQHTNSALKRIILSRLSVFSLLTFIGPSQAGGDIWKVRNSEHNFVVGRLKQPTLMQMCMVLILEKFYNGSHQQKVASPDILEQMKLAT